MIFRHASIHEFGHFLGFAHEGQRKDAPLDCKNLAEQRQGGKTRDPLEFLTEYDLYSIMNYCNPIPAHKRWLSFLDAVGVQMVYGERINASAIKHRFAGGAATEMGSVLSNSIPWILVMMQQLSGPDFEALGGLRVGGEHTQSPINENAFLLFSLAYTALRWFDPSSIC